jgi:hypothetical protein
MLFTFGHHNPLQHTGIPSNTGAFYHLMWCAEHAHWRADVTIHNSQCTHACTPPPLHTHHTHTHKRPLTYCNKETLSLKLRLISLQTESVNNSKCCSVTLTVHQQYLEHTRTEWQAVQLQVEDLSTELGEFNCKSSVGVTLHYSDLYWHCSVIHTY